jgi:hypothetical protein
VQLPGRQGEEVSANDYTVTDLIEGTSATVPAYNIAETLSGWYVDAPADVSQAIRDVESRVRRGEDCADLAAFLQVTIVGADD